MKFINSSLIITALAMAPNSIAAAEAKPTGHIRGSRPMNPLKENNGRRKLQSLDLSKRLHEVSFLTAHNSNANIINTDFFSNQFEDMKDLIEFGTYGHMIDIRFTDGRFQYTHNGNEAGDFTTRTANELLAALDENPNLVLWFDMEMGNHLRHDVEGAELRLLFEEAFDQIPRFRDQLFNFQDPRWANLDDWPTLQELIDAGQRVIMVVDNDDIVGQYGPGFIMRREDVTMENAFGTTDASRCDERHKFNDPTVSLPNNNRWTRLFTMNHFNAAGILTLDGEHDNWSSLYKHIETCMSQHGLRKPNFVSIDWVGGQGDERQIVNFLNSDNGGIILYENNNKDGDIVCGIPIPDTTLDVNFQNDDLGCENDEARSMELIDVPVGTVIEICDSPGDCNPNNDDVAYVTVKQQRPFPGSYISTFETDCDSVCNDFKIDFRERNGLDGKVSRVQIRREGISGPPIQFFEGNSCTQDVVFEPNLPPKGERQVSRGASLFTSGFTNDEARSVGFNGPLSRGVRIEIGDNADRFSVDDNTVITLSSDLGAGESICVSTFETDSNNGSYTVHNARVNGLDGKVSRIAIENPSSDQVGYFTEVTNDIGWSASFSEENGGFSVANLGPIVGLGCSGNDCDNKWLLQSGPNSACKTSESYWTGFFSEENRSNTHCQFGYFVSRLQCSGRKCDNIRMQCTKESSQCSLDRSGFDQFFTVGENDEKRCPEGQVVTGMRCFGSFCENPRIFCSKIQFNDA